MSGAARTYSTEGRAEPAGWSRRFGAVLVLTILVIGMCAGQAAAMVHSEWCVRANAGIYDFHATWTERREDLRAGEIVTVTAGEPSESNPEFVYLVVGDVVTQSTYPGSVEYEIPADGSYFMEWGVKMSDGIGEAFIQVRCRESSDADNDGTSDTSDPDDDNDELDDTLDPDPLDDDADDDGIPDGEDVEWIQDAIRDVPASSIKSPAEGNRNAMLSILNDVEKLVAAGNKTEAVRKLRSLLGRVDGCGTKADKNDWILDCSDQVQVRGLIQELISNLTT